jgi:lysophospholipase L1-like esterase
MTGDLSMSTTNSTDARLAAIVERREFLKRGAITLGAGWLGLGGVRELLASSDGAWARAYAGVAGPAEPFRMAVIGDSVMWGQGLAEQDKIHTKVLGYIANGLNGRPVEKQVAAHSGAIIGLKAPDLNAQYATNGMSGEMPRGHPTIGWQAMNQIQHPELVDLVLMNGGINDVVVEQILTLDYMIGLDALRQRTRELVGAQMQTLLTDTVMPHFPRATIVVSNYFPIISWDSAMDVVGGFVRILFPLAGLISLELQRKLTDQSLAFHDESTKAMQAAVANANKQYGTDRVRFAPSGFYGSNAMGAWNAFLYSPAQPDPLASSRALECPKYFANEKLEMCKQAQSGHPNPRGALAYASNIHAAVKSLIPGWALPAAITVATKQIAVSVVTTTTTTSSKTIVVSAKDAATGQPLSGAVAINGVAGSVGQAITFPRCYSTETVEGPLGKPLARKIYTDCEGTVSASGYPDALFAA